MIWTKKLYILAIYIFARTAPRLLQNLLNRAVSYMYYIFWGRMRRYVQRNLERILNLPPESPQIKKIARKTFENYGLYLRDYVLINSINKDNFHKMVAEQQGTEHIQHALKEGKGAILITPHLGNWELGGVTLALSGCPVHALTLKDSEEEVQEFRDNIRGSLGIKTIHIDLEDQSTILKMARLLRENKVIAMLGDRWEGGKKSKVTYFGKDIYFPSGAMALAQATGCPVIPVFVVLRPDGRYKAWMEKPIQVERKSGQPTTELLEEKTQELATVFENVIREYPDQWYNFFDYWSRYRCEDSTA